MRNQKPLLARLLSLGTPHDVGQQSIDLILYDEEGLLLGVADNGLGPVGPEGPPGPPGSSGNYDGPEDAEVIGDLVGGYKGTWRDATDYPKGSLVLQAGELYGTNEFVPSGSQPPGASDANWGDPCNGVQAKTSDKLNDNHEEIDVFDVDSQISSGGLRSGVRTLPLAIDFTDPSALADLTLHVSNQSGKSVLFELFDMSGNSLGNLGVVNNQTVTDVPIPIASNYSGHDGEYVLLAKGNTGAPPNAGELFMTLVGGALNPPSDENAWELLT